MILKRKIDTGAINWLNNQLYIRKRIKSRLSDIKAFKEHPILFLKSNVKFFSDYLLENDKANIIVDDNNGLFLLIEEKTTMELIHLNSKLLLDEISLKEFKQTCISILDNLSTLIEKSNNGSYIELRIEAFNDLEAEKINNLIETLND